MTKLKKYYRDTIEKLLQRHIYESKKVLKARAYLESIADQLENRFPNERRFIISQLAKASQLSLGYNDPTVVLRELDSGTEKYLKRNTSFDLLEQITPSTLAKPRTLDDFEIELELLVGGETQ